MDVGSAPQLDNGTIGIRTPNYKFLHNLLKMVKMNLFSRGGIETQTQRMDLWTQQGKERVGQIERVALTYIHYHV